MLASTYHESAHYFFLALLTLAGFLQALASAGAFALACGDFTSHYRISYKCSPGQIVFSMVSEAAHVLRPSLQHAQLPIQNYPDQRN